jgi:CBS domain-containing protein
MKIRDCEIDDEHLQVGPDDKLSAVKNMYCHFLVVVEDKKPIGIVTNNDLIKNVKSEEDYDRLKFRDIMSSPVTCAKLDDDLEDVGKLMFEKGFMSLPVVNEDDNFIGLVTYFDYLGMLKGKIRQTMDSKGESN